MWVDTLFFLPVQITSANDLVGSWNNGGSTYILGKWQMSHMVVTKLVVHIFEFLLLWVGTTFFALTPTVIVSRFIS